MRGSVSEYHTSFAIAIATLIGFLQVSQPLQIFFAAIGTAGEIPLDCLAEVGGISTARGPIRQVIEECYTFIASQGCVRLGLGLEQDMP
jgi:hypothetical protein